MRCTGAREAIDRITARSEMDLQPSLVAHVQSCRDCAEVLRRHFSLIALLRDAAAPPELPDLSERVLARLDEPFARRAPLWRWAAVAACVLAALALGFYFGQFSAGSAQANDSMASTYQAAFTGQTAGSAELAYLEAGSRIESPLPARGAP